MTRALAPTAVATLLLAACSSSSTSSGGATAPSGAATGAITIQLTEFRFLMPDEILAGDQTLHVENIGGMPHFIDFQQAQGTRTDDEIQALAQDPKAKQPLVAGRPFDVVGVWLPYQ